MQWHSYHWSHHPVSVLRSKTMKRQIQVVCWVTIGKERNIDSSACLCNCQPKDSDDQIPKEKKATWRWSTISHEARQWMTWNYTLTYEVQDLEQKDGVTYGIIHGIRYEIRCDVRCKMTKL